MELCGTCSHRLEVGGLDEDITAGLLVYGPAQRAQRRHKGLDRGRKNGELGKAERLADLVLQVQVLHIDLSLADIAQQPT